MSKPTPSRPSPSAFPILMRLPDLRVSKEAREVLAVTAVVEQESAEEAAPAEMAAASAEMPAPTLAVEQPVNDPIADVVCESSACESPAIVAPPDSTAEVLVAAEPAAVITGPSAAESIPEAQPEPTTTGPVLVDVPAIEQPSVAAVQPAAADVTDASPADSSEPVAPAAARRQRALERQRRQTVEPQRQRNWWTTHLPVIGVCFLVALLLTIYVGRRHRARAIVESQAAIEVPILDIDIGHPSDSLAPSFAGPETLLVDSSPSATKPPPLLSAKPKVTLAEENAPIETPPQENARAALPSSDNRGEIVNEFVNSRTAESAPATAELSADNSPDYPSTERAVYRPGGRVPREARVPNYPQTSTPHLR